MNGIKILFERQVISILSAALFAVIFLQAYGAPVRAADGYSAEEKIYLKNVTPILYEYSQVASQVSANVLPLQSAPPEKCSGEFSSYYSIMSSLGKQLGTITPPARFESVQADSASAISDYETALNLYSAACTQEDFGTKGELVSRAGAGVNRSVASINKVYKDIEDLGAVAAAPPAAGSTAPENLSESAIETTPLEESVQIGEQYVEEELPVAPAATPAPKTREKILEELADTGVAPEAVEVEKAAPPAPVVEAPKATPPPAVKAPEPAKPAPKASAAPPAETAKIETPAATAPPAAEPEPVATEAPPAPEKPEAARTEPVPSPEAAAPAPAATEEAAPTAGQAVSPAEQAAVEEALQAAEEVGPPPPEPGDVTGKSTETAALAPEELKEEALPEDEINTWCSGRYQTDFERESCVKKRTAARDKAEVLVSSFEDGTPEREIVEKCRADWKEGVTYNYEMVVSCTQFFCNQKGLEACTQLAK